MIQNVDCIISAQWMLPIMPQQQVFKDCCLVIDDGRILGVHPQLHIERLFRAKQVVHLAEHLLMPGLVNCHGHAAMTLLRGCADDMPLLTWLQQHVWPAEKRWVDPDFVRDGSLLAMAEMIATGTTCFSDMYFFPEITANAVHQVGMRAQIAFPVLDFATPWATDADDHIHRGLQLYDDFSAHDRIRIAFGPHAPYTLSDAPLLRVSTLAEELQSPIHIHLHETADEVNDALRTQGKRPISRLFDLGALTPLTQCVHMTHIDESDVHLLQQSGASVIHCPKSNLKLASGICPVEKLRDAEIRLGLGTDGAASNNELDLFGELACAALIGKWAARNAAAMSAFECLFMATQGGADALGLGSQIGSLEAGKYADVIALPVTDLQTHNTQHLLSHLVYNNRQVRVSHAWVAGQCLMREGVLTTIDTSTLTQRAKVWQNRISPQQD